MNLHVIWMTLGSWISGLDAATLHSLEDLLLSMTLRGTIVLILVWGLMRIWRLASAAQQHLVWMIACGTMLVIPFARAVVPAWEAPMLHPVETGTITLPAVVTTGAILEQPAAGIPGLSAIDSPAVLITLGLWIVGATFALGFLALSHLRARRLIRQSRQTADPRVLRILKDLQQSFLPHRTVALRQHNTAMPMTYGTRSPVILLPYDLTSWSDDRLRDVLIHELAHVKRFDCLLHTVASIVCAIQWFNPMVWYAVFQLRTLREEACDNYVLASGSRPSRYATHLLDLIDTLRGSTQFELSAVPFARKTRIQQRLHAIMNARRVRTHVSWQGSIAAVVLTVIIAVPLSAFTPVPRTAESPSVTEEQIRPARTFRNDPAQKRPSQRIEGNTNSAEQLPPSPPPNPAMLKLVTPLVASALLTATPSHADTVRDRIVLPDTVQTVAVLSSTVMTADSLLLKTLGDIRQVQVQRLQKTQQQKDSVARIRIRGAGKGTTGSNDPIVVIDGKRVTKTSKKDNKPGPLDEIDPNTIETIEVLKGPSAVERYGPEAKLGVILITTKKQK